MSTQDRFQARHALEVEYKAWLKLIQSNGAEMAKITCEDCDGGGETECQHCHEGTVDCEGCNGEGYRTFPDLDDYARMKKDEQSMLQMWIEGTPTRQLHGGHKYLGEFLFSTKEPKRSTNPIIVALVIPGERNPQ